MLLGGSLCGSEKYKGPLFARKKPRDWKNIFLIIMIATISITLWESGKKKAPAFQAAVAKFWKDNAISRGLASDKK